MRTALSGLTYQTFLERSFEILLRRSPMTVVELGLEGEIDVGRIFLDDLSDEFLTETQAIEEIVLELGGSYDASELTPEQRIGRDAYLWYLDDRVRGHRFAELDYRITPFINSAAVNTQLFFTDIHPIANADDAERYVLRLRAVGQQMRQVRDVARRVEGEGIVTPALLLDWSLPGIRAIADGPPRSTPYFTAFAAKLDAIPLDGAVRIDLLHRAESAVAESVMPGYRLLGELVADQLGRAPDRIGAWQYPDGDEYYAHSLRHHITTDVSAEELHQLGLDELDRIHGELETRFAELGYPAGGSLSSLMGRAATDGGLVPADGVVAAYTAIIDDAEERLAAVFDRLPSAEVVVTGVPSGGFYVGPSLDNSRPGAFFATVQGDGEARFGMRTLAYHEAVPGHHLQIGVAHDLELPLFQRVVTFTGFAEGWALYAERLAAELGWYEGDPTGDVGRLQAEAFRAARLVVDTGIHAMRWTFDRAVDFFADNTGYGVRFAEGQIARYASWPGQATAYWMGRTMILDLRAAAEQALGAEFDLTAFHRAVLGRGSVPLDVLEANVRSDFGL